MISLQSKPDVFEIHWESSSGFDQKCMLISGILTAAGSLPDLELLDAWVPRSLEILGIEATEELLLQMHLFVGYPKSIEALKVLRKHAPLPGKSKSIKSRLKKGIETSRKIYGKQHPRLLELMESLHPDLRHWMIEDGYGRVLARPGLSLELRELAVLVALMVTGMPEQFRAHLRGAVYLGISSRDIRWFIEIFQCIIAPEMQAEIQNIVQKQFAQHA